MKIQLPTPRGPNAEDPRSKWARVGLNDNPFPESGVETGVFYTAHIEEEVGHLNAWLQAVAQATDRTDSREKNRAVPAFALFGSNGSGKSHLLSWLEREAQADPDTEVLRRGLADKGQGRLTLAGLLLRHLPQGGRSEDQSATSLPLLEAILDSQADLTHAVASLPDRSVIKAPLRLMIHDRAKLQSAEYRTWLARWLRREYTTPAQRAKLGLSGVLQEEGEAVGAIADLARLAHHVGLFQVWLLLIDQLEDLWTAGTNPTRRSRFLTDLRGLIDHAMEGAPIAVLLSWNTRSARSAYGRKGDIHDLIQRDYNALWERLQRQVSLEGLRDEDVWPFAQAYLRDAGVLDDDRNSKRQEFVKKLERSLGDVLGTLEPEAVSTSGRRHLPRSVLREWQREADAVASAG